MRDDYLTNISTSGIGDDLAVIQSGILNPPHLQYEDDFDLHLNSVSYCNTPALGNAGDSSLKAVTTPRTEQTSKNRMRGMYFGTCMQRAVRCLGCDSLKTMGFHQTGVCNKDLESWHLLARTILKFVALNDATCFIHT